MLHSWAEAPNAPLSLPLSTLPSTHTPFNAPLFSPPPVPIPLMLTSTIFCSFDTATFPLPSNCRAAMHSKIALVSGEIHHVPYMKPLPPR